MSDAPTLEGGGGGSPLSTSITEIMQVLEFMGEFNANVAIFTGAVADVLAVAAGDAIVVMESSESSVESVDTSGENQNYPEEIMGNAEDEEVDPLTEALSPIREDIRRLSGNVTDLTTRMIMAESRIRGISSGSSSIQDERMLPAELAEGGGPS